MNPKISLIIPVYNVEKYLEKCLESAISQTLKDIEIIVVNDGSDDSSYQICKQYEEKDSRIIVINQDNSGLGVARNSGLDVATGEFICFLDSDDWLDLNGLEECYSMAEKNKSDIVVFGFDRIDEDSQKVVSIRNDLDFDYNIDKDEFFRKVIRADFKHMACSMIVKRELYTKYNLKFPSTLHEDLYVTPKLFYFAEKVSFLQNNYYNWLIRKESITNNITSKHIDGIIIAIFDTKTFLLKENIYKNYHIEFTEFYLTYLNLIFKRIFSLEKCKDKQNKLIYELLKKASAIVEIKELDQISNIKQLRFKNFIDTFIEYSNNQKTYISNSDLSHKAIQYELNKIIDSRGYKILLFAYKIQNKIIPLGSKRRNFIKHLLGKRNNKIKNSRSKKVEYNIVFMPHKDYHVWTMGLIAEQLAKENISSCMVDLTDYYRDEGSRKKAKDFPTIPFLDYKFLRDDLIDFNTIVCMNDWEKRFARQEIIKAKRAGKKTIGIVEGIQDFFDLDTMQDRKTYKTVEYALLTGEHDCQFFTDSLNKTHIIGIPRLASLLKEEVIFPKKPLAVINMNFSYNVLVDKAEEWLQSAIRGCEKAKIDYIITQHPADKTDLKDYPVTNLNMYDIIRNGSIIISRFSSTILEALAMGKPVVYHNSHGEKAIKFQEPLGAYSLSFDSNNLANVIEYELGLDVDYRARANKFLDCHCNINSKKSSLELSASEIIKINKCGLVS